MPVFSKPVSSYTQEAMDFVMGLAVPSNEEEIPATYADFVLGLPSNAEYEEEFFDDFDFEEADNNQGTLAEEELHEHGQNDPTWLSAMNGFKSASKYEKVLAGFLRFHQSSALAAQSTMEMSLVAYLDVLNKETNDADEKKYRATTIRMLVPKHQKLSRDEVSNRTSRSSPSTSSRSSPTINISFSGCQISAPVTVGVNKEVTEDEDELSIMELIRRRCSPEVFEIIKRENDAKFGRVTTDTA